MSKNEKSTRRRTMKPEELKACADVLAVELKTYSEGKPISLNYVHDKFDCIRSVAMEIINLANKKVRRYFEILEDIEKTTKSDPAELYVRGLMLAFSNFKRANNTRSEEAKFILGDKFEAEFPEDDLDKVILTRVHRAATPTDTVED